MLNKKRTSDYDREIIDLFIEKATRIKDKTLEDLLKTGNRLVDIKEDIPKELMTYSNLLYKTLQDLYDNYEEYLSNRGLAYGDFLREAIKPTETLFPNDGIIGVQGLEGSNSERAANKIFPFGKIMYFKNFANVFDAVEQGLCKYGILPIENSSNGSVKEVYDLMAQKNFYIVRSNRQYIRHELLGVKGAKEDDIREIYSHSQALGQCTNYLNKLNNISLIPYSNTALAAKKISELNNKTIGAIASRKCADLYGLEVINSKIQNSDNNYTRFICISNELEIYPGSNKISIMTPAANRPGGLYEILAKFASLGLNLSKLESRPIVGSDFEFIFYFDFEASIVSDKVVSLLCQLKEEYDEFTFLGNYLEV